MSDMICRKSMMRCQTPGMCSPHGGCHEPAFNPDWNRLEAAQDSLREHMQIIAQLKAENAGLKTGYEAYERVNAELKSENEALRKDAERYQWTSIEGNWVARMLGKWRAHIGEYGNAQPTDWYPSREEAIDAAMGKGEQS